MLSTFLQVLGLCAVLAAAVFGSAPLAAVAFCALYVAHEAGKAGR